MELFFLILLIVLMAGALASGYPVAFALPGSAIITIVLAAACGYLFVGDTDAFFAQGGPSQWLSAGVTNLRGVYWEVERDTLIAIPLFIFMGIMLQRSKIAEDLLMTMAQLFGPVPGGLGISVIFVGALLAATTGILGATVVAMGLISLPAMLRNNYSKSLSTGAIAASGTLGQIIPPSIVLIILADQLASAVDQAGSTRQNLYKGSTGELTMPSEFGVVSTSAGEMFLGAFVPGLVLVGLYMTYVLVVALVRPKMAPAVARDGAFDSRFLRQVVITLVPPLTLIFLVLGSIISGIATVNQAGAIGAAGALLMAGYRLQEGQRGAFRPALLAVVCLLVIGFVLATFDTNIKSFSTSRDQLGIAVAILAVFGLLAALVWSGYRVIRIDDTMQGVMLETAKTTSLVFIILLGAAMLTAAFRAFGGEDIVREFLNSLPGGFWAQFIIVMVVIFLLGFFLDFIEIAVVVVPIVAPILLADPSANITAVWLGVMIGLNIQTSFLTPPFGFALFYLRGVAPAIVRTLDMYKGVIAFIVLQLIALGIVGYYPSLVNYLPNRVSLTSETAPPPRNPKLQYCLEEYVGQQFLNSRSDILASIIAVQKLDMDVVPPSHREALEESLLLASKTPDLLDQASAAAQNVASEAKTYRPLHGEVRRIEKHLRAMDREMRQLRQTIDRLAHDDAEQRNELTTRLSALSYDSGALEATIPENWSSVSADFKALRDVEREARRSYRKTSDKAYGGIRDFVDTVEAGDELDAIESQVQTLLSRIQQIPPEKLVEELAALTKRMKTVGGTQAIQVALKEARRALKANQVDRDGARDSLRAAADLIISESSWRRQATETVLEQVRSLEQNIRSTIGVRMQSKLNREQALFIAACSAHHRDISLNF